MLAQILHKHQLQYYKLILVGTFAKSVHFVPLLSFTFFPVKVGYITSIGTMADDFDDLDDYLDDFDAEILSQEPGSTVKSQDSAQLQSRENNDEGDVELGGLQGLANAAGLDADFAKSIAAFMNELDPTGAGSGLEGLLETALNGSTIIPDGDESDHNCRHKDGAKNSEAQEYNGKNGEEQGFHDTINETINRLKQSSRKVDAESTQKMDRDEELLTTLLNSLDLDGDGAGFEGMDELKDLLNETENGKFAGNDGRNGDDADDEGIDKLSGVLMKMLNRLTSKEMMYETVNAAVVNYRNFFRDSNTRESTLPDDYLRYEKQLKHLENVIRTFDAVDYNEEDVATREYIDQEMEEYNKLLPPPPGVVQDDLEGMGLDGLGWNDKEVPSNLDGCVQQ